MYYKSKYGHIYYEVHGKEKAPLIVFTHGLLMNHKTFKEQLPDLVKDYRVILWDMPGHGSSFELGKKFNYPLVAECLIGLLDEIKAEKAVLAGLSLGGQVSQYTAYYYPDRVSAVVDIGSIPLHKGLDRPIKFFLKTLLKICWLIPEKSRFAGFVVRTFSKQVAKKNATREYLTKTVISAGKRKIINTTNEMLDESFRGIRHPIKHPILIIHGTSDKWILIKKAKKWHEDTSESRYSIVPDASHIANQDNPKEFNRILLSFLKKLDY